MEIQMNEPTKFSSHFLMMGASHVLLELRNAGMRDLYVLSEIFAEGSTDSVLKLFAIYCLKTLKQKMASSKTDVLICQICLKKLDMVFVFYESNLHVRLLNFYEFF